MELALGIILLIAALFLIVAVLLQHGKSHSLSGTIAGGAETFFGKGKAETIDRKLSKITTIVAIIFVVLVLLLYIFQDTLDGSKADAADTTASTTVSTTVASTTAASTTAAETTAAATTDAATTGAPETTGAEG